jgi:HEPN domain-containing protein
MTESQSMTREQSTYDLLIVTSDKEKKFDHEIIQTAEQQAISLGCQVTTVVQQLNNVNKGLENGNRFISTVYRKGVLVYDDGKQPLAVPPLEPSLDSMISVIEVDWKKCFGVAQCFLNKAIYCNEKEWYEQTVFDLHQATQHACTAILRVYSGYRSSAGNLSRLLSFVKMFSHVPGDIFPCTTKEESALFNILNKSHTDLRYNENYAVTKEAARLLIARVSKLVSTMELLYQEKLLGLKSEQSLILPINDVKESV